MAPILAGLFATFGVSAPAISLALYLVLKSGRSLPTPPVAGPAVMASLSAEASFRAAYLVNAAVRLQNSLDAGMSPTDAVAAETKFYELHQAAQINRRNAAQQVDRVSVDGEAGWKATLDSKTSPECAAADGSNFRVDDPPSIGYPGAVHPHCRCRAVRPYRDAGYVEDALSGVLVGAH
jgi:SPP1 gp7 family putative phage head morphogenesis protein